MQPDILIFLSNQHDGRIQAHMGDSTVRTPHLDRLAREGVTFTQAYTPCPLCVPARMSLLTGQLPSHTGVFTNSGSIHPEMPTFLHALELAGYETVLCGRMHFEGEDQRHGFSRRIARTLRRRIMEDRMRSCGAWHPAACCSPGLDACRQWAEAAPQRWSMTGA